MIIQGDCLEELKKLEDNSVDSVVTDPPYGISFMGKKWDYDVPKVEVWKEVLRVLKPGGHALVACGTRTQHRMAVNLEDAGFEIRDIVAWIYGSGFPKSYNIGKNIDKYLKTGSASWNGTGDSSNGALGYTKLQHKQGYRPNDYSNKHKNKENINEKVAKQWEGWGTALKPAMELWTLCRKPLSEKNIAKNVLKWGTGGINIEESRVGNEKMGGGTMPDLRDVGAMSKESIGIDKLSCGQNPRPAKRKEQSTYTGRFPANLIHDGSEEVVKWFPNTKGSKGTGLTNTPARSWKNASKAGINRVGYEDNDSASRFFYCAKASKSERNKGLEGFEYQTTTDGRKKDIDNAYQCGKTERKNNHPTVKPIKLMQYLCRLITPKGGTVLDCFMGSGSTGIACKLEGFEFIGIELSQEYCDIAEARIKSYNQENKLF